jgi:hypothetical protein
MYFPRNWEFGSALSKTSEFQGGFELPKPHLGMSLLQKRLVLSTCEMLYKERHVYKYPEPKY